ncbi:hypothetical protein VB834_02210 [Limnoraphis robusta Tam1]|uniref:hypothetical protein n=1 Tax=Limnoraphis robusta TaxID=1118279 RepID=UPI002B208BB7|nr:hypothetical protein [Limnoraphis robusta]MEA5537838.1 hypothetical protein [Limnoraphis robusta Tam1]
MNGFLSEPSQASFAIVEEFSDRVLRAENVQTEWKDFLREKRSQIWQDFNNLQNQVNARKKWSELLESVESEAEKLEKTLSQL